MDFCLNLVLISIIQLKSNWLTFNNVRHYFSCHFQKFFFPFINMNESRRLLQSELLSNSVPLTSSLSGMLEYKPDASRE